MVGGALSLEDGRGWWRCAARRRRRSGRRGMLLVERPWARSKRCVAAYGAALSVAAVNTASSTVVSGESSAVEG